MRHPLVDEPLPDVAARRRLPGRVPYAGDLGFLALPLRTVGEQVVRVARAHDAGPGESERHAGRVDSDPAAAPLLGDIGSGSPGTAGGIEN